MIVDVLDTMMIMAEQEKDNELRSMVNRAEEWVTKELDFDEGGTVNTFEVRKTPWKRVDNVLKP